MQQRSTFAEDPAYAVQALLFLTALYNHPVELAVRRGKETTGQPQGGSDAGCECGNAREAAQPTGLSGIIMR